MKKVIVFIVLLLVVLWYFGSVQEGFSSYDSPTKKRDLLKNLINLQDLKLEELKNSPLLTDDFKNKQADEIVGFLKTIPETKMGELKENTYLVEDVRNALKDAVNNNKNNTESTQIIDNTTVSKAKDKLNNKIKN